MTEMFEWALWVVIVTLALCWMVMLAYMALGPSSRDADKDKTERTNGVDKPKDDKHEDE